MINFKESVTFQHVVVDFTPEEWQLLECDQETLYWDVMLENYTNLISVGYPVTKTKVILKVEREQSPWLVEGESLPWSCPETDCSLDEPKKQLDSKDHLLKSVFFTFKKIFTMENLHYYNMSTNLNSTRKKSYKSYRKSLQLNLDLLNYNQNYTGENSYECSQCGKAFKKKFHFIRHEKSHIRNKPFVCNDCGKAFIQKTQLVAHQRLHTGEKPYECGHCGKTFTWNSSFYQHVKSHTLENI